MSLAFITGTPVQIHKDLAIAVPGGIGYAVRVNDRDREYLLDHPGQPHRVYLHEKCAEGEPVKLYGFLEVQDLVAFRGIISIKGVGPEIAMRILSQYDGLNAMLLGAGKVSARHSGGLS